MRFKYFKKHKRFNVPVIYDRENGSYFVFDNIKVEPEKVTLMYYFYDGRGMYGKWRYDSCYLERKHFTYGKQLLELAMSKGLVDKMPELFNSEPLKECYQCEKPVPYLFDDSRCKDCTRLTVSEIRGDV